MKFMVYTQKKLLRKITLDLNSQLRFHFSMLSKNKILKNQKKIKKKLKMICNINSIILQIIFCILKKFQT